MVIVVVEIVVMELKFYNIGGVYTRNGYLIKLKFYFIFYEVNNYLYNMCIICTGEIYKQNLNTLIELDVSDCESLTSDKLQEVLIQCKNLKELHCSYCTSLTSLDLRSNINLIELYCFHCTSLTSLDLRSNINLIELHCYSCTSLTSLDLRSNINLIGLYCYNCSSLTSIDLRSSSEGVTSFGCINLTKLGCSSCTSLTSLDLRNNIKLEVLDCASCTSLTSLDLRSNINLITFGCHSCTSLISLDLRSNINLIELDCFYCTSLTNLDLPKGYHGDIDCSNCAWISQNEEFLSNLQRLIKLQRWYRKLVLIKYLKSQEFIEWVYSPNNIGGRLYKKWLLKNLK